MGNMQAMTFRQKQDVLDEIFLQYRRAKLKLECLQNKNFYPKVRYDRVRDRSVIYHESSSMERYVQEKDELEQFIATYDEVISCLSVDSREIITREFVNNEDPGWWIERFSRSTYYRMKTRAMEEVLFYLNL